MKLLPKCIDLNKCTSIRWRSALIDPAQQHVNMDEFHFKIIEHDVAGKVTGTFVGTKADSHEQGRIDLIVGGEM